MKIQHDKEKIMTKCEAYLMCRRAWSDASCMGNETMYKQWLAKGLRIRNTFSKEDWEELIGQSTGRAKYVYTRMMNERFPNDNEQSTK